MSNYSPKLSSWLLIFFWFILGTGCVNQNEYQFMVVGVPKEVEGVPIINSVGKQVGKLTTPWVFTIDQIMGVSLPLNYQVYHSPWNEPVFVKANQINFCPNTEHSGQWQSFDIHYAQEGTLESPVYRRVGENIYFRVAIDMGPSFEFIYRCNKNGQVEIQVQKEL